MQQVTQKTLLKSTTYLSLLFAKCIQDNKDLLLNLSFTRRNVIRYLRIRERGPSAGRLGEQSFPPPVAGDSAVLKSNLKITLEW